MRMSVEKKKIEEVHYSQVNHRDVVQLLSGRLFQYQIIDGKHILINLQEITASIGLDERQYHSKEELFGCLAISKIYPSDKWELILREVK